MRNLTLVLAIAVMGVARAGEVDEISSKVYQITLSKDFKAYSSLLHPDCKLKEFSERAFQMRSDVLHKQKPGARVEGITIATHRELKAKSGSPFEDSYSVTPSHYVVIWPAGSEITHATRFDLNPVVKINGDWKILDGSCISSKKR